MTESTCLRRQNPTKWLTAAAMLMALNIALSSFSVPVPGGHLYLCLLYTSPSPRDS